MGKILGRRPAHLWHAEGVDDPRERPSLGVLDALVDVRRALLRESIEIEELLLREREQVRGIGHEAPRLQLLDEGPPDALDVEATARDEVPDPLTRLCRACRVRAAERDLAFAVLDGGLAHRTALRHRELRFALRSALPLLHDRWLDPHDLGDDIAGALDDHAIADADVEPPDLVEVVQRRAPHGRAADEDRREPRHRREHAGPADVHLDLLDGRRRLLRRELVRDGPAWVARHEAEPLLIGDPVDLHDDAVGAVVELLSLRPPLADEGEDLVDVRRLPHVRIRAQAELAQPGEQGVLRVDLEPRGRVAPHRQVALGRRRRVELPDGAGRGVARVRERRLLALEALAVRRLERGPRRVHLAANVDAAGHALAERERDGLDRAQVRGDVLAHRAVAARRALREAPVDVREVDREPVDLQLADVADVVTAEGLADALVERPDLGLVERVRQRQHRVGVLHRGEAVRRRDADALGRRFGGHELGVLRLQVLELAEDRVVGEVVERGLIEDVVVVVRLLDLLAQLGDPLLGGGRCHAPIVAKARRPGRPVVTAASASRRSSAGTPWPGACRRGSPRSSRLLTASRRTSPPPRRSRCPSQGRPARGRHH